MLLPEHRSRCLNPQSHNLNFHQYRRPQICKSVLSWALQQRLKGRPCDLCESLVLTLASHSRSYMGLSVLKDVNTWSLTAQCWAPLQESRQQDLRQDAVVKVCCVSSPPDDRSRCCPCCQQCWHLSRWGLRPDLG